MSATFSCLLEEWSRLLAAVRESEADFPVLTAYRVALESHLENVRTTKARQLALQADCREATRDLQQRVLAGKEEVRRLRNQVKAELGSRNPRLKLFGVAPLAKRKPRLPDLVFVAPAG